MHPIPFFFQKFIFALHRSTNFSPLKKAMQFRFGWTCKGVKLFLNYSWKACVIISKRQSNLLRLTVVSHEWLNKKYTYCFASWRPLQIPTWFGYGILFMKKKINRVSLKSSYNQIVDCRCVGAPSKLRCWFSDGLRV